MENELTHVPADIAFVFDNVGNYQSLVAAFRPGVEVHVLDAHKDGLEQMASILAGRSGVAALHIVGHGSTASINLGTVTLDAASVPLYWDVLGRIGASLAPDGDILLYGCDVASDAHGVQFVDQLAQATGADLAASTNATGGDMRGGDWTLEYSRGEVTHLGAMDGAALHTVDTLLALPAAGLQDVTQTMDVFGSGTFIDGFKLTSTVAFVHDDPDGLYFYSTASGTTATRDAALTVEADNSGLGSFDLTGMAWKKYAAGGDINGRYGFTVTGYKPDGTTVVTTFHNSAGSTGFDVLPNYSSFTGIIKYTVAINAESLSATSPPATSYPVSNWTFDNFTIANPHGPNVLTAFLGGTTLNASQNGGPVDAAVLLHVSDTDDYQTLTWSQSTGPSHGTLSFSGATAAGGGTNIAPGGTVTYTPTAGYVGADSFTVRVYDGFVAVTKTITVDVSVAQPSTPDLAVASDTGPSSADNITNAGSLSFSGSGASGDSASTVHVFIDANDDGIYNSATEVAGTATMSNGAWTVSGLSTSGLADGTYKVRAYTTSGASTSTVSNPLSVTIDKAAPTLAITSDKAALKVGETATITFAFSEAPTAFSSGDIAVTGGTLGALSGTGATRTATFTPTAGASGNASITVAAGSYTDLAGNNGGAGTTPALAFDTLAPTLAISSSTPALKIGQTATITFTFSEDPGATFTAGDVATSGGTLGALSGTGTTRTATFTPFANSSGTASVSVAGGAYTDGAGNAGGAGTSPALSFDTQAPTLAITSDKAALKAGQTATITFTFSEDPGTSFTFADIGVTGGTLGALSGTGAVRTATFTPSANTDGGNAVFTVAASTYNDLAGNAGAADAALSITFDTLVPNAPSTPDLATADDRGISSSDNLTSRTTPTFTGTAEDGAIIKLFDGATQIGTGTATGGTWSIVSSALGQGAHSITAVATDAAGNASAASAALAVTLDTVAPTLSISSDVTTLRAGQTATITFTFSEDPGATFSWDGSSGDIIVTGGTLGAISGSGATRTAVFTPDAGTNGGTASISVAAGAYTDAAGNNGGAGTTPGLNFDTLAPGAPPAPVVTAGSDTGASATDGITADTTPTLTGTAEAGATVTLYDTDGTTIIGSGTATGGSWTITTNALTNGTHAVTAKVTDLAGNTGGPSAPLTFTVDTVAPTLTISSDSTAVKASETALITFNFSEDPGATFDIADIAVSGGTLGALSGSGTTYTAIFTPTAGASGTASITVASGNYADAAGNNGGAGTAPSLTFDTLAPTLSIASNVPTLKAGQTATITFTFSEDPGASFDFNDIVVSGGTLGALSGTGAVRTATFTPAANTDNGVASITVPGGAYTDAAGNGGAAGASPSLTFDTLVPLAPSAPDLAASDDSGLSSTDNITSSTTPIFTGTAEAGASVKLYDGATLIGTGTAAGGNWSITSSTLGNGAHSITAVATDAAGNTSPASAALPVMIDTTPPTLSITSNVASLKGGQTATVTFTFSEDPGTTFAWDGSSGDVVVTGGTLGAITGSGTTRTAVFTPNAGTNSGTASITVASNTWSDAAGNGGGAGTTPALSFDTLAPTLAITSSATALKAGETATITFTFSEDPGGSFIASDIVVAGGTLGSLTGTGTTRTAVFTPTAGQDNGTATITVAATAYQDAAGNDGQGGASTSLLFDTVAPAAPALALAPGEDTGTSATDNLTRHAAPIFTGSAEDGAHITLYDGATAIGTATATGGTWTTTASTLTPGSHTITATATDAAGNVSIASSALGVTVDTSPPTLAMTSSAPALKVGEAATITFTFSEDPGSTFEWDGTTGDLVVAGGTLGAITGSGTTRTAVFTPSASTNGGSASITVSGSWTDAAGNAGLAAGPLSLTFDTLAPALVITSDTTALKAGETAAITFTFSEDPGASFALGDITVSGGALASLSGSGTTRTAVFTPGTNTNGGSASISVLAGTYADAAGNGGGAGSAVSLTFDTLVPTAPSQPSLAAADDSGVSSSDTITNSTGQRFSGTAEDGATVTLYDGATAIGTATASGGAWLITASGLAEGAHNITAHATDAAGNVSAASTARSILVDRVAPTLAITSNTATLKGGETATVTFTFSEDPGTTFSWDGTAGDIAVSGGTLSALAGTGTVRTATFTPVAGTNVGSATISVAYGDWTDAAGNTGGAATAPSLSFDTLAPSLAITSSTTTLRAGQTATITFTFSEDPGASFADTDIAVSGGTLGTISGSGTTRTAVFTPTADTNGTATITVSAASYTDAAGNAGTGAFVPALTLHTLAPIAPTAPDLAAVSDRGVSDSDNITNSATPTFTGTAENGVTVTLFDGATEVGTAVASGGAWSITTTALTDGTHTLNAIAADPAGNTSPVSGTLAVTIDTAAPTLAITSDRSALKDGETATITFTFSEDPGTTFSDADIAVTGGTLGALSGSGATRSAVFTPTAGVNAGTASISVAPGSYTDTAGNAGGTGSAAMTIDTVPPAAPSAPLLAPASDTGASSTDGLTNAATLVFGGSAEAGSTVTLIDANTSAVLGTAVAAGGTWSIAVAGLPEGVANVAATATDAAGNVSARSAATAVTVDRTAPGALSLALVADTGAPNDGLTSNGQVKVNGIDTSAAWQYSLNGGTSWISGSGSQLQLSADGTYSVTARQLDQAGNISAVSAPLQVRLDATRPSSTVTLNRDMLVAGETAVATITFSEAVGGFDTADISAGNATVSNLATTDGGHTWTALVTPAASTTSPTNVIRVANTGVADAAGNTGSGTSESANYAVLTAGLGASIELSDTALMAGETSQVTIRFSERVTGFTMKDLDVANGTLSGLSSTDSKTWTALLTPAAGVTDSTNVITLDNSGVAGASGRHGTGTSTSANYTVSTVRPAASVTVADHLLAPGATTKVTIRFSEAVSGFDNADLRVTNGTLSTMSSADGGLTWTAALTATAVDRVAPGWVTIDMPGLQNAAGNTGIGKVFSFPYVVLPAKAVVGTTDGVTMITQQVTDPDTGLPGQIIVVPEIPATGSAQIPLGVPATPGGAGSSLTAGLPGGAGIEVSGPTSLLTNAQALIDLIARIGSKTSAGSPTQTDMTGHGLDFLGSLGSGVMLESKTLVPTVAPGSDPGQPIVISGNPAQPNSGAPVVGLVIDGTGLPVGTTLQLDNVEFAAVMGDIRLIGGQGRNYVVGDGGSQVIYLGPDDDILSGGGGNDFIGSAGGDDRLDGGDGKDLVVGGAGNDTVLGGAGDDVLNGGRSTNGSWEFYVSASGKVMARHSGAVFTQTGTEVLQGAELDASVPELGFLGANPQQLAGIALLYAGLGRTPDLAGLSYWSRPGLTLQDVANGVLASAEWSAGPLGQMDNESFVRGMYEGVLGHAPDAAGLAYWAARLGGNDGAPAASRTAVLVAVALSDEHRAASLTADGLVVARASVAGESNWFGSSGNDRLDGGPGNDVLVGGDGFDTAVYSGLRSDYHILIGSDHTLRVAQTSSGDVDTLSGIEAAEFANGTLDLGFLNTNPGQAEKVGMLFQTVFDRAGDVASMQWWLSLGMGTAQLAQAFIDTGEFKSRYGGMNDSAFVHAMYDNSGLDTSAAGGMQSWQTYLSNHTRAELVAAWIANDSVLAAQFGHGGLWLV